LRIDTGVCTENKEEIIHTLTRDNEHDNQSKYYYTKTSHNRMCASCFYLGNIMDRYPAYNNDRLESVPVCCNKIA
jgi:hypothetical protein